MNEHNSGMTARYNRFKMLLAALAVGWCASQIFRLAAAASKNPDFTMTPYALGLFGLAAGAFCLWLAVWALVGPAVRVDPGGISFPGRFGRISFKWDEIESIVWNDRWLGRFGIVVDPEAGSRSLRWIDKAYDRIFGRWGRSIPTEFSLHLAFLSKDKWALAEAIERCSGGRFRPLKLGRIGAVEYSRTKVAPDGLALVKPYSAEDPCLRRPANRLIHVVALLWLLPFPAVQLFLLFNPDRDWGDSDILIGFISLCILAGILLGAIWVFTPLRKKGRIELVVSARGLHFAPADDYWISQSWSDISRLDLRDGGGVERLYWLPEIPEGFTQADVEAVFNYMYYMVDDCPDEEYDRLKPIRDAVIEIKLKDYRPKPGRVMKEIRRLSGGRLSS